VKYGMVKILKTPDGEDVKLVGNAMTYGIYKSYFNADLLEDIIKFAGKNLNPELLKRFEAAGIKNPGDLSQATPEQKAEILGAIDNYSFDSVFVMQFISALIATAQFPNYPDMAETMMSIPPHWAADEIVINEVMEFFSLFIKQKQG